MGLSDWVASLPDGLDTVIGPGGGELSAGEMQLVAFARLMVRDPLVVILDEATARMDPVTDERVTRAAARLLHKRTGILVAHRINTLRTCEELAVLESGRLAQFGSRPSLVRTPGPFADLVTSSGLEPEWVASDFESGGTPGSLAGRGGRNATSAVLTAAPVEEVWRPRLFRTMVHMYRTDVSHGAFALVLFGVMAMLSVGGVVTAAAWGRIVEQLQEGSSPWVMLGIYIGSALAGLTAAVVSYRLFEAWRERMSYHLRYNILAGQLATRRVRTRPAGEVVSRAFGTDAVIWFVDSMGSFVVIVLVSVLPSVLVIAPAVGVIILVMVAVSSCLALVLRRRSARLAGLSDDARARSVVLLASLVDSARTLKLFGTTGDAVARYEAAEAERASREVANYNHHKLVGAAAGLSVQLAVISVWVLRAAGVFDTATAVAASVVVGSMAFAAWAIQHILSNSATITEWFNRALPLAQTEDLVNLTGRSRLEAEAVMELLPDSVPLERFEVDDLTVVHDDGAVAVEGVTFAVDTGEMVVVIGEVGSGKSSLLAALAGLRSYAGELRWNGEGIDDPEVFLRPRQVAYVAQHPKVLSGSIADNVALGHNVDVAAALQAAALMSDVERIGGVGTLIGHRGVRLSGGQVQRLALARALAPETELLILDDVSSALDASTELEVWQSLRQRGCAVIASSSKLAAVQLADRVVVLEGGRQVAMGPWSELSEKWGQLTS